MGLKANYTNFFRQLKEDVVLRIFLPAFILVHVPYFFPGVSLESMETYGQVVAAVFLMPFTVFVLWPRQRDDFPAKENSFWKILSIAFVGWWLVNLMYLSWPEDSWSTTVDVITDAIFLGFYVGWLVAVISAPHVQVEQKQGGSDRLFLLAAAVVLALGLFFYFILIPSRMASEVYDSWVPSLLFFTGVDCVLALLFVHLAIAAKTTRWRVLYSMFAAANIIFTALDFMEALHYNWVYTWAMNPASDVMWSIPFLMIVIIARARYFKFQESTVERGSGLSTRDVMEATISPVIMVSFVLPVLHITLDQFGFLHEGMRRAQAAVVLGSLVIFWVMAILENISLRVVSQKVKAQSTELEELRIKQAVAEKTETIKGRFLANVSHEIRTPLNGILGLSEILLRGELEREQRQHAGLLKSSAQEMICVVDDILDYSKIEAGELSLVMEPFRLDQLAEQVLGLFGATERSKNVEMNLEIQDDVPLGLEGDASRLRQVLVNLLSNAVKFTNEGEIRLQFSVLDRSESITRVHCKVSDSGIGINADAVDDLFLPFSQADESCSRKYGGSGLGLSISRQIIEAHGGEIGAYSKPEGGSVFWFEIPFKSAEVKTETPILAGRAADQRLGKRILLAEDDEINQIVARKQLETLGYQVDVVKNGKQVLEVLEQRSYALILMDCQMPELDGLQATRLIREKGHTQSGLPIIALTANVFDENREACFESGMNDFVEKPFLLENLRRVLDKWL